MDMASVPMFLWIGFFHPVFMGPYFQTSARFGREKYSKKNISRWRAAASGPRSAC
jgi:hypothetical protein